ncbi:MAG: NAD(P)/FAD-dependent oxidoreductase, partial [Bacteroidales bacterium]|nr:NAD(P)/FAD-dependent oxidoreductase [Bacteroidales bacterium]
MTVLGESLCGTGLKNVNISLIVNGNTIQEEFGEIDFTDGGLEGPVGFRISRNCVESIMKKAKTVVSIDLKPAVELTSLKQRLEGLWKEISEDRRSRNLSYREKLNVLLGKVMPQSLIPAFM